MLLVDVGAGAFSVEVLAGWHEVVKRIPIRTSRLNMAFMVVNSWLMII